MLTREPQVYVIIRYFLFLNVIWLQISDNRGEKILNLGNVQRNVNVNDVAVTFSICKDIHEKFRNQTVFKEVLSLK